MRQERASIMAGNLLTDIAGIRVGHANAPELSSGVTAVLFDEPVIASVDVRGGGPGSHETDLLDPAMTVERIDAISLSGGSAFGLEAACGIQAYLREQGRGFAVAGIRVPIVPGGTLFDLHDGTPGWQRFSPYRDLGHAAAAAAVKEFALGSVGAGLGATTVNLKAGIGSASACSDDGQLVAALVAVNAAGSATVGPGPWFWAAPFEHGREFGGRGWPSALPAHALELRTKGAVGQNTTIGVVATSAVLTKGQVKRLAMMAQDGLARALYPVHTLLDGDLLFAVATGQTPLSDPVVQLSQLGALAANVVARAIARAVFEARALASSPLPSWQDVFSS
jgi:D-aminopeptidase